MLQSQKCLQPRQTLLQCTSALDSKQFQSSRNSSWIRSFLFCDEPILVYFDWKSNGQSPEQNIGAVKKRLPKVPLLPFILGGQNSAWLIIITLNKVSVDIFSLNPQFRRAVLEQKETMMFCFMLIFMITTCQGKVFNCLKRKWHKLSLRFWTTTVTKTLDKYEN